MTSPIRYSKGVTNVASEKTMGQLLCLDPTLVTTFMDDFFKFDPGEWIATRNEAQLASTNIGLAGSSEKIADGTDGVLACVTSILDDDYVFFQKGDSGADGTVSEMWTMIAGKKLWFKAKLKCNDVDTADFYTGLVVTDTSPVASVPADGFWFISDDGDAYLDFHLYSSSASQLSRTAVATLTDDTFFTMGLYWDGIDTVHVFYNDRKVAAGSGITPTTTELALSFGIQNGSGAASTLSMDYLCVVRER